MRSRIARAAVAVLLVGVAAAAAAHGGHHRGHHHGKHYGHYGYYLGAPLWWGPVYDAYPYYYGPRYGYGPGYAYSQRPVIIEREPTVYVQREPVASVPPSAPTSLWFYCTDPAGYFPYVEHCSQSWISVDPNSVSPPPGR